MKQSQVEMFYLNSTWNFGIPPVLVFQLEIYYKVDRLLTGLAAQQKWTTARWYSNKTPLYHKNLDCSSDNWYTANRVGWNVLC